MAHGSSTQLFPLTKCNMISTSFSFSWSLVAGEQPLWPHQKPPLHSAPRKHVQPWSPTVT